MLAILFIAACAFASGLCLMYAIDRGELQLVRDELQTRWRDWNVSRG